MGQKSSSEGYLTYNLLLIVSNKTINRPLNLYICMISLQLLGTPGPGFVCIQIRRFKTSDHLPLSSHALVELTNSTKLAIHQSLLCGNLCFDVFFFNVHTRQLSGLVPIILIAV